MNRQIFNLPNLLTSMNLMAGCLAVFFIIHHWDNWVVYCIAISMIMDFLDGMAARKLGIQGEFGVQLDSLADVVSFGVVPAFMLLRVFGFDEIGTDFVSLLGLILPLVLAVFSALRLAKFNIKGGEDSFFRGLNTPTSTLFVLGIYLAWQMGDFSMHNLVEQNIWILLIIVITLCFLLISNIKMFSSKNLGDISKYKTPALIFAIGSIGSIIYLGYIGITISVILYILVSLFYLNINSK